MIELNTSDLILHPLLEAHADELFGPLQDRRIYDYIADEPPASLEGLRKRYAFLAGGKSGDGKEAWLNWIVYQRSQLTPIGIVQATVRRGKDADIAYIIFPDYWNLEYGRKATKVMIDHVFEIYELTKVAAYIDTRNHGSIAMVEALGLRQVRMIKDADNFKGSSSDEYVYEVTREEWALLKTKN